MSKKDLKAYIRYDGTGRAVPGSLILQRFQPKVGNWQQTSAYECCDPSCLPLVYGDDFIIADIVPYDLETSAIVIQINPEGGIVLQGGLFDCDGKIIQVSEEFGYPFPESNLWIVQNTTLLNTCDLKFRRVCFGGAGNSGWVTAIVP